MLPLYIAEPELWAEPDASARHWDFVAECLEELRTDLGRLGAPLVVRVGDAVEVLERAVTIQESPDGQIAIYERLGVIWAEKLGNERQSIDAWHNILAIDSGNMTALWALSKLYRDSQAWEELVDTLHRLIESDYESGETSYGNLIKMFQRGTITPCLTTPFHAILPLLVDGREGRRSLDIVLKIYRTAGLVR